MRSPHLKQQDLDQTQLNALVHVKDALNFSLFPNNVFDGTWHMFRFFESERMFEGEFVEVIHSLLVAESAQLACMVNLDRSNDFRSETIDAAFIRPLNRSSEFNDALREGGPQSGWLFDVDRYGCSSSEGGWCIYCEKSNDVAVIALRRAADLKKYEKALTLLDAQRIDNLLRPDLPGRFPFNRMVSVWREGLVKSYGSR